MIKEWILEISEELLLKALAIYDPQRVFMQSDDTHYILGEDLPNTVMKWIKHDGEPKSIRIGVLKEVEK